MLHKDERMDKQFQLCSIPYSKRLGQFFKDCRTKAGITQAHLASELGLKSSQFISNVERGICAYTGQQLPLVIKNCLINRGELLDQMMNEYRSYLKEHI